MYERGPFVPIIPCTQWDYVTSLRFQHHLLLIRGPQGHSLPGQGLWRRQRGYFVFAACLSIALLSLRQLTSFCFSSVSPAQWLPGVRDSPPSVHTPPNTPVWAATHTHTHTSPHTAKGRAQRDRVTSAHTHTTPTHTCVPVPTCCPSRVCMYRHTRLHSR